MGCPRERLLSTLDKIAPLHFAEKWDNVGLLIDPDGKSEFEKILLTIDLTDQVVDEALSHGADFILSYHPPIFSGLKRLRLSTAKERVAVRAIRSALTVYSPHTALDAVPGGMGDWLARALGPGRTTPLLAHESNPNAGVGRFVRLDRPLSLDRAVTMAKAHLGLKNVRVSQPSPAAPIKTVAVCPGAGGAVFEQVEHADLFLTGEMRHHDVLDRRARGSYVLLTDHTNTERGYLQHLAQDIISLCPGLAVQLSRADCDPLAVV